MKDRDFDRVSNVPMLFGSIDDYEEFVQVANECIQGVQASTSPREMVLETWLLVDYCVRELLLFAFDLKRFNNDDFDLRYEFLPKSFLDCLRALRAIYKVHRNVRPPKQVHTLTMTGDFMAFFADYDKSAFTQLGKAQRAYLEKYHPDLATSHLLEMQSDRRGYVSENWLKAVEHLSEKWFTKAERLNRVRNIAAHTHNQDRILSQFGFSGQQAIEHTKTHCLTIIRELIGIIPKSEVAGGD